MTTRSINALRIALHTFRDDTGRLALDDFAAFVHEQLAAMGKEETERPCCLFLNVNNITYKGHYLPSPDEFEAHGYDRTLYEKFMEGWKESIDKYGKL